jgi:hypothetical protein
MVVNLVHMTALLAQMKKVTAVKVAVLITTAEDRDPQRAAVAAAMVVQGSLSYAICIRPVIPIRRRQQPLRRLQPPLRRQRQPLCRVGLPEEIRIGIV